LWYYINILEKTKGQVSTNVKQLKKGLQTMLAGKEEEDYGPIYLYRSMTEEKRVFLLGFIR
jgi:hypothetical protein